MADEEGKFVKTEPMAELRQMAQVCWQLYTALHDEGFNEEQAMKLVRDVIVNGLNKDSSD